MTYIVAIIVTVVTLWATWKIGGWLEHRQKRKIIAAREPVAEAVREKSRELVQLASQVNHNTACLLAENSKLAPTRVIPC